jgi:hypothetical protein
MKAPLGALVSIYYDSPREIKIGEVLRTPTDRFYIIAELRRQKKGKYEGRWHIKAIVSDKAPEGAKVHPIYWYPRKKK